MAERLLLKQWSSVFRQQLRYPGRRTLVILCLLFTVVYFTLYRSDIINRFFPKVSVMSPAVKQQALECQDLIESAERILDGEPIPLPFSGNTWWKFKQRVPSEVMKRNAFYGKSLHESAADISRKRQYFNVNVNEIKAMKMFITFGDRCCELSKKRAVSKAKDVGGFDDARSYNLTVMSSKFRQTHNDVLKDRRGAGYWLWKPYILLKTLVKDMKVGDIVMYHDAGAYFIRSAAPLLKLCEQSKDGIMVFGLTHIEHVFTKQDAFLLMNMSIPIAADTFQRLASFVVLRKCCTSIQFVMEWIAYLSDRRIASDDPNTLGTPNPKSFRGHRHDQSVFSLLSKKWGLPAFRDPSQFGRSPIPGGNKYSSGPYEQIINHDRNRH